MNRISSNGATKQPLSKELLDRQPPRSLEAEKGVLGGILLAPKVCDEIAAVIRPQDFYDVVHQKLFAHILWFHQAGQHVDSTLLVERLKSAGDFEAIGGAGYIAEVSRSVQYAANAIHYAEIVREHAARRRIILTAADMLREAYSGNPTDAILSAADQQFAEIRAGTNAAGKVLTFRRLSCAELDAAEYATEYLVEWLLVAGQPCIVAGQKKALKTSMLLDLAISLAIVGRFLGCFRVTRSARVCVMTGESGLATIQETLRRIATSVGRQLSDIGNLIISDQLPQFGNVEHLDAIKRLLVDDEIEVLIIDPAYLCIPTDGNEGSIFAMGHLLRCLNELCLSVGVTLVLAHHTKRGVADPFAPPELEDIAWAGFQEFARQWILLGRRERYEPGTGVHRLWMNIGGSAGHSSMWAVDIDEGSFEGDAPRRWNVQLAKAEEARRSARERQEADKEKKRQEAQRVQTRADKAAILDALAKSPDGDTEAGLRARSGVRTQRIKPALAELLAEKALIETKITKGNNRVYPAYRLTPDPKSEPLAHLFYAANDDSVPQ